jgi:hypothetical protein
MRILTENQNKTIIFDNVLKIKQYLDERIIELEKLATDENHKNPYVFMGISALFDLLSNLPYSDEQMSIWRNYVSPRYIQFLNDYVFDEIQQNFSQSINLGELFYKRVRCGLDHSFSTGNEQYRVLLSHENNAIPEEVELHNCNGIIEYGIHFTALSVLNVLKHAINKLFNEIEQRIISDIQVIQRFSEKKPLSKFYE